MAESSTATTVRRFSPRPSLAAIGLKLRQVDVFGPIRSTVTIAQKTVKHTPAQKLYDAFITMLAGAHGLVEINARLRSDRALQAAFGRAGCAEQSVVQQTLDACTAANAAQLERVVASVYDEVVVDRLFAGTAQLTTALQPLVLAAEQTLELDQARRARTILRVDAGGGSLADTKWA